MRTDAVGLIHKRTKKTKADIAKDNGLEGLSVFAVLPECTNDKLLSKAKDYLNENVLTIEEAIEGAKLIIAQSISENINYRTFIRELMAKKSIIYSSLIIN